MKKKFQSIDKSYVDEEEVEDDTYVEIMFYPHLDDNAISLTYSRVGSIYP